VSKFAADNSTCRVLPNDMRVKIQSNIGYAYPDIAVACGDIEFEVNKLFVFELPAFTSEFEKGEKNIFLRSDGLVSMVTLHNKNEFVQYNLGNYIEKLRRTYIAMFDDKRNEINDILKREVNKQGEKIFGANTMGQIALALLTCLILEQKNGTHFEIDD
jgi:hypothetical protein